MESRTIGFIPVAPHTASSHSHEVMIHATNKRRIPSRSSHRRAILVMSNRNTEDHFHTGSRLYDQPSQALYDFLTRRAVKTIMYYFDEFHDGPSKDWLNTFDNFGQREDHFTGSDAFLVKMLKSPRETCIMTIAHPKGYFKREFKSTIEPAKICERIMSVRKQLAEEWSRDLQLIARENLEVIRVTLEKALYGRDHNVDRMRSLILDHDMFTNDYSALRSSNYAKLKTMLTHYASYQVLENLHHTNNHEYMWFNHYLRGHVVKNDEDFVLELIRAPVVNCTHPHYEIFPRMIAEKVLEARLQIANDWIFLLSSTEEANRRIYQKAVSMGVEDVAPVRVENKDGNDDGSSTGGAGVDPQP